MYDIENELSAQSNVILELINKEQYSKAIDLLDFVTPLWHKVGYSYKVLHYNHRMQDEIRGYMGGSLNWKLRKQYENLLEKLIS